MIKNLNSQLHPGFVAHYLFIFIFMVSLFFVRLFVSNQPQGLFANVI